MLGVIKHSILHGLDDHSERLRRAAEKFASNPASTERARPIFERYRKIILFEGGIRVWQAKHRALDHLIIEDNAAARACIGYLVYQKRVFDDVVQLLAASRSENWTNWPALWAHF